MRPRTEVALGLAVVLLLALLAGALARERSRPVDEDPRRSSYLTGPRGARGLSEALVRLGILVRRFRQRPRALETMPGDSGRRVLAVLDPMTPLSAAEGQRYLAFNASPAGGDLLLAGKGAESLMRCFGFGVEALTPDSVQAHVPGTDRGPQSPWIHAVLAARSDSVVSDSSRVADAAVARCVVPPVARVDTLLVSATGRVVVLRLERADVARRVTLAADGELFSNGVLRRGDAGPVVLGLFAGRYDTVVFDEYQQGFGAEGSLAGATLAWSRTSPLGWALWQLALVGTLALLLGAVRFGPVRRVLVRQRRSPLEHVRALATALAAARGHDVAIGAIVQGLRRRLLPPGQRPRGDWRSGVAPLAAAARSARARDAVRTLESLIRPGQTAQGVLRAANAVEDLWEELRP
jgi:hypothetical protein